VTQSTNSRKSTLWSRKAICFFLTFLFLDEAMELKRIVLAGGTDIIDDDIIMSDFVTLLGVVPEVAGVLDKFAAVIVQNVINGNNTLGTVTGRRVFLQPDQPFRDQFFNFAKVQLLTSSPATLNFKPAPAYC